MSLEKAKELISNNKVDVFCFDIFDTIITRKVYPEYIKKIWSKRVYEYFFNIEDKVDIYILRNEIESQLCLKNQEKGFDLEFKYKDMLINLYKKLLTIACFNKNIVFEDFFEYCLKTELEIEKDSQNVDLEIVNLIKLANENNIKVICISDFYHTKDSLEILFKHHKILDLIDDIYVSSDYLLTKRTGRFYKKLIDDIFKDKKLAMIGDNIVSDYDKAIENNIIAFRLDRKEQFEFYEKHKKITDNTKNLESQLKSILENSKEEIYFKELSFSIFYFIYKLYFQLKSKNIKNVFFLSREGQFLKKVFDIFTKEYFFNDSIKSHYLLVSRKSTFLASLKPLEEEKFDTLFRQYRKMTILNFLKNLSFNETQIDKVSAEFNINEVLEDLPSSKEFEELKKSAIFKKLYEEKRLEQQNNLKKYIRQFGTDIEKEGLSLVDVGWKGTIQDNIYYLFDEDVQINGFYLGLVIDLLENKNNYKAGLLFDYKNVDKNYNIFSENTSLYEVFLAADHGSAEEYNLIDDLVHVKTNFEDKEKDIFEKHIRPFQLVTLNNISKILSTFKTSHSNCYEFEEFFASMHSRMIHSPKIEEVRFFKKLYHYENFGIFGYSEFSQNQDLTIKKKIINFFDLVISPRKVLNSGFWKASTLDDLGLFFLYKFYVKYRKYKNIFKKK